MTPLRKIPAACGLVSEAVAALLDAGLSGKESDWLIKTAVLVEALKRARGNKCRAARLLGIHRNLIDHQIDRHELRSLVDEVRESAKLQLEMFSPAKVAKRLPTAVQRNSTAFIGISTAPARRQAS